MSVRVYLFGSLVRPGGASTVALELPSPFTAREVIEELAQRLGPGFRSRVLDAAGRKYRHCRVFVDGLPAEDLDAPVATQSAWPQVEMILLTAAEGG